MLTLYHAPQSRAVIARWMLEEVGEPYEVHPLSFKKGENRQPAYLAINPMGKVPALDHDGVVVTEVPAICCYLADAFPQAGLAPPIGDRQRGPYLKWLFFYAGSLEPAVIDRMLKREPGPRSTMGYGDFDTMVEVVAKAVARGPFLLGDRFTAADVVIGSGLRWATFTKALPERTEIARYVQRLSDRPAPQRVMAKDAELAKQMEG
jgi:glutathione S-transferase